MTLGMIAPTSIRAAARSRPAARVVHVVDDDEQVRMMLTYVLSNAGLTVRPYDSAESFLEAGPEGLDGCLLTDVCMPGMGGMDLMAHLRASGVRLPVVVMSGRADIALAVAAMKAGAVDFLQKPVRNPELVAAILRALELSAQRSGQGGAAAQVVSSLSRRQRQVLEGVAAGKLNKVIAHELGLSVRTVEDYRLTIMAKTGAANVSDLVRLAVSAGL